MRIFGPDDSIDQILCKYKRQPKRGAKKGAVGSGTKCPSATLYLCGVNINVSLLFEIVLFCVFSSATPAKGRIKI